MGAAYKHSSKTVPCEDTPKDLHLNQCIELALQHNNVLLFRKWLKQWMDSTRESKYDFLTGLVYDAMSKHHEAIANIVHDVIPDDEDHKTLKFTVYKEILKGRLRHITMRNWNYFEEAKEHLQMGDIYYHMGLCGNVEVVEKLLSMGHENCKHDEKHSWEDGCSLRRLVQPLALSGNVSLLQKACDSIIPCEPEKIVYDLPGACKKDTSAEAVKIVINWCSKLDAMGLTDKLAYRVIVGCTSSAIKCGNVQVFSYIVDTYGIVDRKADYGILYHQAFDGQSVEIYDRLVPIISGKKKFKMCKQHPPLFKNIEFAKRYLSEVDVLTWWAHARNEGAYTRFRTPEILHYVMELMVENGNCNYDRDGPIDFINHEALVYDLPTYKEFYTKFDTHIDALDWHMSDFHSYTWLPDLQTRRFYLHLVKKKCEIMWPSRTIVIA